MHLIGFRWWIRIWYVILFVGVLGLGAAIHWGRQTAWNNKDEVLRGIGTIACSAGFLVILQGFGQGAGYTLLFAALVAFILAFIYGRDPRNRPENSHHDEP